jgi:hypothetical protein
MHLLTRSLLSTAALAALALPAQAALTASGLDCNYASVMTLGFQPQAVACSGAWAGNDMNQRDDFLLQAQMDFSAFVGNVPWTLVGSSDDSDNGPFSSVSGGTSGTLSFDNAITGFFAVSLMSANSFSVYLFNGGSDGISSIDYSTFGVSLNAIGMPQDLSHATLITPIPEPETYALMAAGLGIVGWLARRRRPSGMAQA